VRGRLQIVCGVLTTAEGIPVAVQVFKGNTGDPATLADQVKKLKQRFGRAHAALAGDRG
jgi:transposase